jgi:hypothetical protein
MRLVRPPSVASGRAARAKAAPLVTALETILTQVRERIVRYRDSPIGEQDTKAALIDPVLRALGWDVEDLEEVQREYRLKSTDNPVDYALSILRTPRLFVEAKALGGNLNDRRWANQIMGYAAVAGVEWVILTNGDEYRIYNSHATVPVEEKVFRTIRIADEGSRADDTLAVLSKERMKENWIDVLWKAHFVDRQIRAALEELFSPAPDPSLVRLLGKRVTTLSPGEIKAGLGRVRVRLDFPEETPPDRPPAPVPAPAPRPARPSGRRRATPSPQAQGGPHGEATPWRNVSVQDLIAAGLIKPPLHLEKTYKGRRATGRLEADGRVTYDGKTFDSLSIAAGVARASVIGAPPGRKYPQTNGWTFWRFKDANGELKPVDCLRQRHFQSG